MASFRLPLISSSEARAQHASEARTAPVGIQVWIFVAAAVIVALVAIQSMFTGRPAAVLSYLP